MIKREKIMVVDTVYARMFGKLPSNYVRDTFEKAIPDGRSGQLRPRGTR